MPSKKSQTAATEAAAPVAIVEKPVQAFPVPAAEIVLWEERTKLIPLPATLFLEDDPAKVAKPKGHQVDPSRGASYIAVMPSAVLLAETGNPYPASGDHETVVTDTKWRPLVSVAHAVWKQVATKGETWGGELPESVADVPVNRMAVRDALRDLALFGLVVPVWVGKRKVYRRPA